MSTPFKEIPIVADLFKFRQVCIDQKDQFTRVETENVISALLDVYNHSAHPAEAVHARLINLMIVHVRDI